MAVPSDGSYGIEKDVVFSFPCITKDGDYQIVNNLELNQFQKDKIDITLQELL